MKHTGLIRRVRFFVAVSLAGSKSQALTMTLLAEDKLRIVTRAAGTALRKEFGFQHINEIELSCVSSKRIKLTA
jgi:hypothetical protein